MVTFVVPNLSPSDYLNLPVTVDNKLLAIKKKGQSYFAYLANKYGIAYLPGIPRVVVASLALILYVLTYAFQNYRWLLTTSNKPHLAGKKAKF